VRDRRLLGHPDNPRDRVQRLAATPVREPPPVPALKHIAEGLHHRGGETQLSSQRDRHLARRADRDRADALRDREELLHPRRAHDRLKRRQLRTRDRPVSGVKRDQETLERDVVAEQRGVLAGMPAPDRPHQRRQERSAMIRRVQFQRPRKPVGDQARPQPSLKREPRRQVSRQRQSSKNVNQPGAFSEHPGAIKPRSPRRDHDHAPAHARLDVRSSADVVSRT
jgi:hypothetical protein